MMTKKAGIVLGVLGALMITLVTALVRQAGIPMNLELMLGSMVMEEMTDTAWVLGFVMQLAAGGIFGLIYAEIFNRTTVPATGGAGAGIGLIHSVISGLFLAAIPLMHPMIAEVAPPPGAFAINLGASAAVVFIALHVAFGALIGALGATISHQEPLHAHVHRHH